MIELPEALTIARQINESLAGTKVKDVLPPTKPHKFCWFNGDPAEYAAQIRDTHISATRGFGIYAEISFGNGKRLSINDGVNVRLISADTPPKDYQLLLILQDGAALAFTVAMYGGVVLHADDYENEYYLKSKAYISPFSSEFAPLFYKTLQSVKPSLSVKAFLATEQRFPGIGNGVLQDILFAAGIHPKRKLSTLSESERDTLLERTITTLREMTDLGGRDTEKDLYGNAGGYETHMSKSGQKTGCPRCGAVITKEAYLGGSVYYCAHCQPLIK